MLIARGLCAVSLLLAPCLACAAAVSGSAPDEPGPSSADMYPQPQEVQQVAQAGKPAVTQPMQDLDALAIEMINPYGTVFTIFNNFTQTQYQGDLAGADDQSNLTWDIAGSWPFLLDSGRQLVVRMNFPVSFGEPTYLVPGIDYVDWRIRQDADTLPDNQPWFDGHGYLGDISFGVGWGGTSDSGWITGIGVVGVLPTGQDGSIERDQYLLGPDLTLGKVTDWGILGARLMHFTNVADVSSSDTASTFDTNETHLNVFFAYGLGNGWNLISNPTVVYDWEATSDNKLQVPLGGGVSKMVRWFGTPVKLDFELEYYVVNAQTYGADWLARVSVSPAILQRTRN